MRLKRGKARIISRDLKIAGITPLSGDREKAKHTLKPREFASIRVHRQHSIPLVNGQMPTPHVSTRSVAARLGIEALTSTAHVQRMFQEGKTPERFILRNSGKIPVQVRKGNRIARVYFPQLAKPLSSSETQRMRKSGELVLGRDCKVLPSGMIEIRTRSVVYELKKGAEIEIAKGNWLSGSKRKELMRHFRKVRKPLKTSKYYIVLSETLPVKLPKNVAMFFMNSTDGTSHHIQSHLIDPGFEGPIVLEIRGIAEGKKPDNIIAWLAKVK